MRLEVGAEAVLLKAAAAPRLAAGLLDLDHFGAHVGEQDGAGRALLMAGEVQDADAVEGRNHRALPPGAVVVASF